MTIDDVLEQIQAHLGLEADVEHELLEEIRGHLEEAVLAAKLQGLDQQAALREAAAAFGVDQTAQALRETHLGWGMREALALAGLPVIFTLILRWLIFAPDGTAVAWRVLLSWPNLAVVATLAIVLPIWRFSSRRYALALWAFFWGLSFSAMLWSALRW
jgi:hypothetical protein